MNFVWWQERQEKNIDSRGQLLKQKSNCSEVEAPELDGGG